MSRKKSDERPSIIQEIVFYDKPNIKTVVPEAILPQSSTLPLGKGDIVISRVRKIVLPREKHPEEKKSPEIRNRGPNDPTIKVEQQPEEDVSEDADHLSSIDCLNHFIAYENLGGPLESVISKESSVAEHYGSEDSSKSVSHSKTRTNIDKESDNVKRELPQSPKKTLKSVKQSKGSNDTSTNIDKGSVKITREPPQSPKKVLKSVKQGKGSNDANTEPTKGKSKEASNIGKNSQNVAKEVAQESLFKKPYQPIQKAKKASQQVTLFNFLTKKSKDAEAPSRTPSTSNQKIVNSKEGGGIKSTKDRSPSKEMIVKKSPEERTPKKSGEKSAKPVKAQEKTKNIEKGSSKNSTKGKKTSISLKKKIMESKKPRGRPKKNPGDGSQMVKTKGHYSDEDVSFSSPEKSRSYAELTNVPLNSNETVVNDDGVEELLDETEEQISTLDRVEKDLESMFREGDEEDPQSAKGKKKGVKRKPKTPVMLVKRVKTEEEDVQNEESIREILDTSGEEFEEDSRDEWMPHEYAEYRQQHIMKNLNKIFPCKYCGGQFTSYYTMRKHRALEHNDLGRDRKEGSFKDSVKCKQEKEQGDESDEESREEWMPQEYAEYKMKHKMNKLKRVQWYKCKICCAVFSNYYKLSRHRVEHANKPDPYECKDCDSRFKDVESLMAHIREHQGKDPYQCRKCDKGFSTKEELDEHVPVHILKKGPAPVKRFRCDICSKEFSKLCDIERHTRVHTGEKPSECNICHKRFQQSHNLSKHLLTHLHVKPFQCEICNKKFGRIDVLNRHLLTHSMDKPFNCEICKKGFIRQVQLTNHIAKCHTSSDTGLVVADEATSDFEEGEISNPGETSVENEEVEEELCEEVVAI